MQNSSKYANEWLQMKYSKCDKMLIFKNTPQNFSPQTTWRWKNLQQTQNREKQSGILVQSEEDGQNTSLSWNTDLYVWANRFSEKPVALSGLAVKADCFMTF